MNERRDTFEAAFPELFEQARRLAARLLGDDQAAEDIAAEAMARAWLRWGRLREASYRDAWVMRVAGNLCLDLLRRRRARAAVASAPDQTDQHVLRLALAAALAKLPRRQREAVVLRYLADLPERDVAAALGISPGTVGAHVHRGLNALRQRLGDDFEEVRLAPHA